MWTIKLTTSELQELKEILISQKEITEDGIELYESEEYYDKDTAESCKKSLTLICDIITEITENAKEEEEEE